jgi:TetR/AcrR family tetracycline transcriptional repressor
MASRPRLNQADYVAAAFDVASDVGLHALTLKALGERLGVDSTAVYRHFRSKDLLLLAMLDRLLDDALEPTDAHASPRAELEHISTNLRAVLLANPPLAVALAGVTEAPDNGVRLSDRIVDALSRMGLQGEDLVVHYQLLEHVVVGSCMFDGDGAPDNWDIRRRRYERIGSREFRSVATSTASVRRVADDVFDLGVRLVLDACESAAGA